MIVVFFFPYERPDTLYTMWHRSTSNTCLKPSSTTSGNEQITLRTFVNPFSSLPHTQF